MKELTFQGAWLPLKRGNNLRVQGGRQQATCRRREKTGYAYGNKKKLNFERTWHPLARDNR